MADEEKKDYTESKNSFMDILARGGEGMIDGFAKSNPMIGGALQAMVGTQDYKDRVDARNYEREQREHGRQVMAEWNQNKAERDAISAKNKAEADLARERAAGAMPFARQEAASKAQANIAQSEYQAAQARLGKSYVYAQRQNDYSKAVTQDVVNYYMRDPNWRLSFPETQAMANDPAVQTAIKAQYWMGHLLGIADGDKESFDEVDFELNQQGWNAEIDENGVMYLYMPNANPVPVTKESFNMFENTVMSNMREAQKAHDAIGIQNSMGNVDKMFNRRMTLLATGFTNGNYADALKWTNSYTSKATEEQKAWMRLDQAYRDFGDTSLPLDARMNELAGCMESLEKLNLRLEGFDPNVPESILAASFIEPGGGPNAKRYSFQELGALAQQNNSVGRYMEREAAEATLRAAQNTMLKAAQNVKDTGKAVSGEDETQDKRYEALARRAKQIWGPQFAKLGEDKRESAYDALDIFDTFKMQYGKNRDNDLSLDELKDLSVMWQETMENEGISGLDFPLQKLLDEKQAAEDQRRKHEQDTIDANRRIARKNETEPKIKKAFSDAKKRTEEERRERKYENRPHTDDERRRRAKEAFENANTQVPYYEAF